MEQKILSWLGKNGFPLEMRIAQQMAFRDFYVIQSAYFSDFETGTPREIDLLCKLYFFVEPVADASISEAELFCAVECKSTVNPWIVFKQTEASPWSVERSIASRTGRRVLQNARKAVAATELERSGLLAGHGVREAFVDSDRAFTGVMSALKAAESIIRTSDAARTETTVESDDIVIVNSAFAIPVVVVGGPLFDCTLGSTGEPVLKAVEQSAVVLRYPRTREGAAQGAVVHIVTEAGWPVFMDWLHSYCGALNDHLTSVLPPNH